LFGLAFNVNRGTTVYLVDRRIDMVPELLSSNLCSLRPDQERLAFSVLWEVTADGEIKSTRFTKSVIRSRRAFTYAEAQCAIDDSMQQNALAVSLRGLNNLAKIFKKNRIEQGYIK
jgi:exosome complex exonuclease DIS3/RRP44